MARPYGFPSAGSRGKVGFFFLRFAVSLARRRASVGGCFRPSRIAAQDQDAPVAKGETLFEQGLGVKSKVVRLTVFQ